MTAVRQQDFVARLGGDEFAILLPETNLPGAMIVAARLHQAIRDIRLDADGRVVRFTGSIGVTAMGAEDAAPTDVLARADAALYQAKQTRDTVSAIEPSPVIPE